MSQLVLCLEGFLTHSVILKIIEFRGRGHTNYAQRSHISIGTTEHCVGFPGQRQPPYNRQRGVCSRLDLVIPTANLLSPNE